MSQRSSPTVAQRPFEHSPVTGGISRAAPSARCSQPSDGTLGPAHSWTCLPAHHFFEDFEVVGPLGEGQFGTVWHCVERASGQSYACKQVDKVASPKTAVREKACFRRVQGHENVLRLEALFESERFPYVVTELCSAGDLFDYVQSMGPLDEDDARALFRQLAVGVAHCHARGVLHRDIKPENILLHETAEGALVKLADFGLATALAPGERALGWVGSAPYEAPEVVALRPYGPSADVWSLGVVLYGILSASWPAFAKGRQFEAEEDFQWGVWASVSQAAKDLVTRMLSSDPCERPTADEILRHPWFFSASEADASCAVDLEHGTRAWVDAALSERSHSALALVEACSALSLEGVGEHGKPATTPRRTVSV